MRHAFPLAAGLLLAAAAFAAPDGWQKNLDDGVTAARQSGKPILVVTSWAGGV